MLRNLPFSSFKNVDIGVASLNFGTIFAQSEFVDTVVLSKVAANEDIPRENYTFGLLFEEFVEVVGDECLRISWNIRGSGEEHSFFAVSRGDSSRVESS